ncbi:MAG: VCBS repeat-containing protein, partial [Candidatus Omnitrophica bacterium]|nr:VCBS repeat-containing protein [Candidatus Omnitrophota bacterium]
MNSKLFVVNFIIIAVITQNNAFSVAEEVLNERLSFAGHAVNVNSSLGSATKSIPIAVPTGRGGVQPNLSLNYNSSTKQGIFGVGWSMDLGYIERSTKRGVPSYTDTDTFLFGQNELVYDSSAGYYRAKIEGDFSKTEKIGNEWIVTDKSGTKYYFGSTDDSRHNDLAQTSNVFRWYLSRVEDIHGNYMTLTYEKDGTNNQIYPKFINYTGYQTSETPFAEGEFILENRVTPHVFYSSGFLIKTVKRVKEIIVKANTIPQRTYKLIYSQSQSTNKDLLTQIVQYDGNGSNALPAFDFDYAYNNKGFMNDTSNWSIPSNAMFSDVNGALRDLGVRIADVNSDGYSDISVFRENDSGQNTREVYINNRNKSWNLDGTWNLPNVCSNGLFCTNFMYVRRSASSLDMGLRIADLNGDGKIDFFLKTNGIFNDLCTIYNVNRTESYINLGNGWSSNDSGWHLPGTADIMTYAFQYCPPLPLIPGKFLYRGTVLSDVNNDGYTDVIRSHFLNGSPEQHAYLNNLRSGSGGWSSDSNWIPPAPAYNDFTDGAQLVDLNGDGLPEIYYRKGGVSKTYINTGKNWREDPGSPWDNTWGFGDLSDGSTQFGDINGDGLADMIIAKGGYSSGSRVLINTGYGWVQDDSWVIENGNFINLGTRLLDADADGMLDVLIYYNSQPPQLYINESVPADLMISSDNGVGGSSSIVYDSSTHFNNQFLPFSFPVVVSVTNSDAYTGDSYQTKYAYADGLWNAQDREFRGFGYVKIEDPEGNYTEADYLQGDYNKGRPAEQRIFDKNGNLFSKTTYLWNDSQEIISGSRFVYLSRKDHYVYAGPATGRRTAEIYYYDEARQLGNLTKVLQLGEVGFFSDGNDPGSSRRTVETAYVHNTDGENWLVGLPRETVVKDHDGNPVRKTWFYYDNHENTAPPAQGLLTKKEEWAGDAPGAVNPVTQYAYDPSYGNLLSTADPRGSITAISYDPAYHIFPLTTVNALGHRVVNEYYGVNGVPLDSGGGYRGLWGQLKSTTDPNQEIGKRSYDTFGSLVLTVSPLDTIAFPTQTKDIEYFPDHIRVTTRQRVNHGQPETVDTVQFIDGMGRVIQTKSRSGKAGQYIVSGQVEYNSRGLPEKQYLNYFTSNGMTAIDPVGPARPHVSLIYDAMGRTTRTANPDGSYSSMAYDGWTTAAVNENGHKIESDFDAYGRLIEKREYLGADGRGAPVYPATGGYTLYAATGYAYDSEGNLVQTRDAKGNITAVTYDSLGRKASMDDPDMGFWRYEYDLNGNLVKQTDAKGEVIHFTYDALNRLANKTDGGSLDVDYTYDDAFVSHSKGRLTQAQYDGGDTGFKYDEIGREIESIKKINSQNFGVKRNYDASSELLDVQYPDGGKIFYKHNPAGQIEAIGNDPALFDQQSFDIQSGHQVLGDTKSLVILRPIPLSEGKGNGTKDLKNRFFALRAQNDDVENEARKMRYDVRNFCKAVVSRINNFYTQWFEPNIFGVKEAYAETVVLATLEAENMTTKTIGGAVTGGWDIWSNGYVESQAAFPSAGTYQFEIIAKGDYAGGAWPNMELR